MLNGVLLLWFILTVLSVGFVVWDARTNTPVSWVQKLAWILVTLYTGPVGLFFYLLACRNPGPGLHDAFTRPHWKQALNSEMHCLAGDATGIILAAIVVSYFGFPNGIDLVIEYTSAFVVGLLVFQALMMRSMYDNNYLKAVRKTFFAETVSMNMVMVGMIPTMVILMHNFPYSDDPLEPMFWFIMGMASIVGGITAYGINSWLVRSKLKHGCMTLPEKGAAMSGGAEGAHHVMAGGAEGQHAMESGMEGEGHQHHHHHGGHTGHEMADRAGHEMGGHEMHEMGTISTAKAFGLILVTFAALLAVAWLTSTLFAPISFQL